MEEPPPVPPKDQGYTSRIMEVEHPSTAQTSGSKRRRPLGNDTPRRGADSGVDASREYDDATPNKRQRSNPNESDVSASEDNHSKNSRSVRRKKGSRNLSNLNLRHAAQAQTPSQATIRGSRFQEGSLTDRPSEQPPSFFTHFSRTDAENVEHVDTLMSEYHDAALTPPHSAQRPGNEEDLSETATVSKKEETKGFFQFGRQLVANFHPVALWRSVWNEAKEELTREDMEKARKAKLKADAEAKYAEMKRTGHYGLQLPSSTFNEHLSSSEDVPTPGDSAIAFDSMHSADQSRITSVATVIRSFPENADLMTGDVPQSSSKPRDFRERLHLKRPSLSNMKSGLKRMRSDLSLVATRESSASVSPVKADFEASTLRQSTSRADLKKQQKLSKRVSDLESKLQLAREELNEALVEASPMPKLSGRHERFTPSGTFKRAKFVPGRLPSLPSERVLLAEQRAEASGGFHGRDLQSGKGLDLSPKDFLAAQPHQSQEDGEATIKASRARVAPPRATALFDFEFDTENQTPPEHKQDQVKEPLPEQHFSSVAEGIMDPSSIDQATGMSAPVQAKTGDYAGLDAKLKALDANIKTARKASQPTKKRKTGEKDTIFKPSGVESDDDGEWEQGTPKKKRKSKSSEDNSPPTKRTTRGGNGSETKAPTSKKTKGSTAKTNDAKTSQQKHFIEEAGPQLRRESKSDHVDEFSTDELAAEEGQINTMIDSPAGILDPVMEEEEDAPAGVVAEESIQQMNEGTMHPSTRGSRSHSPLKRTDTIVQVTQEHSTGAEDKAISRQASRSVSPPPRVDHTKMTTVVDETVTVVPGVDGVPMLPTSTAANEMVKDPVKVDAMTKKCEAFEWPEDVF